MTYLSKSRKRKASSLAFYFTISLPFGHNFRIREFIKAACTKYWNKAEMDPKMTEIEQFLFNQFVKVAKVSEETRTSSKPFTKLDEDFKKIEHLLRTKVLDSAIREKLYHLNNLISEWQMQDPRKENRVLANDLHGHLKKIKSEIKGLSLQYAKQSSPPKDSETYRWSSGSANPRKLYGEKLLFRKERENGFMAIGIVGMAGVGKTALCQEAFNNQEMKKEYLPRIWVCMAKQQPNDTDYKKEVVKRILMGLGFEDEIIDKVYQEEGGLIRLLLALRQELKGKKYLIVLDDVSNWNEGFEKFCSSLTQDVSESEQLAYGLPKGHGGTVIVNSRSRKMAENMVGEKNVHSLLPLADKESTWNIFKDAVAKDGLTLPKGMEKLKDMIAGRCAGLPLFAKMLGQLVHETLKKEKEVVPEALPEKQEA